MYIIKSACGLSALIVASGVMSMAAQAANNKPINAAMPDKGEGCYVSDTGGGNIADYVPDPTCKYHILRKHDKDGNLISLHYQDKGELQPGQTAPDKAIRNSWTDGSCEMSEVITPSGAYSSDAKCQI